MSRVALVTGAARGIGAATVRRLARDGWSIVAFDVCADDPAVPYPLATSADLEALRQLGDVTTIVGDVRDPSALQSAVDAAVETYGGLDAALAVAGVIAGGLHWSSDAETERVVLDVNLNGVLNLARAAVPSLLQRPEPRSGRFIAVASAAATRGLDKLAAYSAAKAGVTGFIRSLAAELGCTGVTANAVSPGSTATPMLEATARVYGIDMAEFANQQPIGRLLDPDEVAAALVWLAGPDSSGMTGTVVAVDGGLGI